MRAVHAILITLVGVPISALAGWGSLDTETGAATPPPVSSASVTPARPAAFYRTPPRAAASAVLPPDTRGRRRVTPALQLSQQQKDMLALDPITAARDSVDATRAGKRVDCKRKLPHASDDDCERILQVDGRTGVKFIKVQQAFLTGQIDQDTYQAETHKAFLEHEIALEAFMPPRDFLAHEGLQPGDDIFLAVVADFRNLPAGYKMGDEVFDPTITPFGAPRTAEPPGPEPSFAGKDVAP